MYLEMLQLIILVKWMLKIANFVVMNINNNVKKLNN